MTERQANNLANRLLDIARLYCPVDTGNMASNAITVEFTGKGQIKIHVDESIAPYFPYTNEPWISERWKGATNPNEGWWNDAGDAMVQEILRTLKLHERQKRRVK